MKVVVFTNQLGVGGTEKAASRWARGLAERGHSVDLFSLEDGPRRTELENNSVNVHVVVADPKKIQQKLEMLRPEVIHAHAPGHPHPGDLLGEALALMPKIPVVQTNIFGQLDNPREDAWTDFRLFISWTSCVQAARRSFRRLDEDFFKHASVAVYPLDPVESPSEPEIETFRRQCGLNAGDIVFGRLSRPEPNKWTDLAIRAFRIAASQDQRLKLLLREPPLSVRHALKHAADSDRFVILPATSDPGELALTIASLDAVLHTSVIGESFGYGIAEPMNLGKPVIANSTPWQDQAQIELVRHGECGFIASTPKTIANAMLTLTRDAVLRARLGENARSYIGKLADPAESLNRLESTLKLAADQQENPRAVQDLEKARVAAAYLDKHQFGHSLGEQLALRPLYYRVRLHQRRKVRRPSIRPE